MPTTLVDWFRKAPPGNGVSPVDDREDTYLFQGNVESIGTKLREGNLEIKWRELARPFMGPYKTVGQVERWLKWNWSTDRGNGPSDLGALLFPHGPWVTVSKRRLQRKYRWVSGKFVEASYRDMLEVGAAVELTALAVRGHPYGTLLLETFGPDAATQQELMTEAVNQLWRDYPGPPAPRRQSYGYPMWLRFAVTRRMDWPQVGTNR